MNFEEYQNLSRQTAVYPSEGAERIYYACLGLAGETGEVLDKVKKIIRDSGGVVAPEARTEIKKELGDILWYLSAVSTEFGLDLDDIAQANIDKLLSRKERGVLQGSGDNR